MSKFIVGKFDINDINGGNKYQNGDAVQADAVNKVVEASAYAQDVAEQAKVLAEVASGTGIDEFFSKLYEKMYPLHEIKIFYDEDINPAKAYGGYWLRIKDCFLWCSGDQAGFAYVNDKGGSIYERLNVGERGGEMYHRLYTGEMPSHTHGLADGAGVLGNPHNDQAYNWGSEYARAQATITATDSKGGNEAHNNMPPYLAVNAWVRVTEEEFYANESL